MSDRNKVRNNIIKQIKLLLGDGMIDIELDPDHYDLAVDIALAKVRQRSENAVEEDFYTLQLKADVDEYTLPEEIVEVRQIWNRSFGHGISGGVGRLAVITKDGVKREVVAGEKLPTSFEGL